MPHILVKEGKELEFPKVIENTKFEFIAKGRYDDKIGVLVDNKTFLLSRVAKGDNYLIKFDKITRVSPVNILKKAILDYATATDSRELFSNIVINNKKVKIKKSNLKDIEYFINRDLGKSVSIEIGFGSGRHILYQAKNNPDKLYIGLEIHKPSSEQLLKQINIQNIENIFVVEYDARLFLEFIESNSVDEIFVHFPVPWDKKPHKRVFSTDFIDEASRVLKSNGTLELRTDSQNYFDFSLGLVLARDSFKVEINKNIDLAIRSKYEDRWRRENKNIFDIKLINQKVSKNLDFNFDFDFPMTKVSIERLEGLDYKKAYVFDSFLIHFETLYRINSKDFLIKLTSGSFSKPEHHYISVKNLELSYYRVPIPSKVNHTVHKKIIELLYG